MDADMDGKFHIHGKPGFFSRAYIVTNYLFFKAIILGVIQVSRALCEFA